MILVERSQVEAVCLELAAHQGALAADTETYGLRPFHGDRLFSLIISTGKEDYYFNFQAYTTLKEECVLGPEAWVPLARLFNDCCRTWYFHNAPFDLSMLALEGIEVKGTVHCTKAMGRLEYNQHMSYDLDSCAKRIGLEKSDAVEKYVQEHHLWAWRDIPGKKTRDKDKFFFQVPFDIIAPYGCQDARTTHALGEYQQAQLSKVNSDAIERGLPALSNVVQTERSLTHAVVRMERVGVQIDSDYCVRAARYEADRAEKAMAQFAQITGRPFVASSKLFEDVFASDRDRWGVTDKGNPSFSSEALETFLNPAAQAVLAYRDAKSKSDFYQGFLYHRDENNCIHPHLDPGGTASGRFNSYSPNFQNLTSEGLYECGECLFNLEDREDRCPKCSSTKIQDKEFLIRRALVPRPGFCFFMPDYVTMEYRMMFDYACGIVGYETDLVRRINAGHDPHQATADAVTEMGTPLKRSKAKNVNFAFLYGSGDQTLADTMRATLAEAKALRSLIVRAAPEVKQFVDAVGGVARRRGFITTWAGRRSWFPDPNWAYKAPNYLIQGGCADVVKRAMVNVDSYLRGKKSRMCLQVHDELLIEVHAEEAATVPRAIQDIMQTIYPHKFLPLLTSAEWSDKSMADAKKGYPV